MALREVTDRFARAVGVSERLLANVERVVHGKREEVKLVLAALACDGHVLFEDVPQIVGGASVSANAQGEAAQTLRALAGTGAERAQGRTRRRTSLAPFALAAAAVPLLFLLSRRNVVRERVAW